MLLDSLDEAASYPTGDLRLQFCESCGFIWNSDFDVALSEYSARYEETQAFSPRFVSFAKDLAAKWVDDHDLRGRTVLEIGCGKGEFLQWMVEAGAGRGIGIDPSAHPERIDSEVADRLTWVTEKYSEEHTSIDADAIVCRHTLEHIAPVHEFMTTIRRAIGERLDTVVLFELPDVQRVLDEAAFWDVYYEHCSYFSAGSLVRLFERTGFTVDEVSLDYDDQYILLVAHPAAATTTTANLAGRTTTDAITADLGRLADGVAHFETKYEKIVDRWSSELTDVRAAGGQAVIWGAGSKGVAFLTSIPTSLDVVACAVDVNPFKTGKFMAGSGHEIVAPEALVELDPELVIVMNPIYRSEISQNLDALGVSARVETV